MRIAFLDHYSKASSLHKDPVTIPQGLLQAGHDIELVTLENFEDRKLFGFSVTKVSSWLNHNLQFRPPSIVVAITRFDAKLTHILKRIKAAGIPLVVKGDTDGSLGYPLVPNYLRCRPVTASPWNIFRQIKWRLPAKYFVMKKIEHIKLADLVVCESPEAKKNIEAVLNYWNLSEHNKKIKFIPNAVSTICTNKRIEQKSPLTVVSVGRWDDKLTKGSDLLAGVISKALGTRPDIKFTLVGNNPETVIRQLESNFAGLVTTTGSLSFEETQRIVAKCQILLVSSRLESFSLAAAEALCQGCSLVATPIESLKYLSGIGEFGSLSSDFSIASISVALDREIEKWERGLRSAHDIGAFWRSQLSGEVVSSSWNALLIDMQRHQAGHVSTSKAPPKERVTRQ